MKSKVILLLFLFASIRVFANMASPITEGTLGSSPYTSQSVDIISENILIIPDSTFSTAQFIIEYRIHVKKNGKQIPLLFYASEYRSNFKAWLDDSVITVNPVPEYYNNLEGSSFKDFSYLFETGELKDGDFKFENEAYYVSTNNLKFFETSLSEGIHTIRVEYIASSWIDESDWVSEYSLRYALEPARYWKSFGELTITLDNSKFEKKLETNFGDPLYGSFDNVAAWKFSGIPTDMIHLTYIPELSSSSKTLIALGPERMTYIFAGILVLLHLLFVYLYRMKKPNTRFSWVVIVGSVLIPLVVLIGYMSSFGIIDTAIGEHAGGRHGYTFMVLILYPVITPFYLIMMWLVDRAIKRKLI